jgi:hypothetical protein
MVESSNTQKNSVRHLGRPCKSFSVHAGCTVVDPSSGRELFAILNMNEISNMELILIDTEKNEGNVFRASKGQGSWGMLKVPNDKLIIGTYYHGEFAIFDLRKMEFIERYPKLPGADYLRKLALGIDGRVYAGSSPGGRLAALDLITYEVKDCGSPSECSNYNIPHISPTPDGRILCVCTGKKDIIWLYNPCYPETKYLFTWDDFLRKDNERLIGALTEKFGIPEIEKTDNGKAIKMSADISLKLNDTNTEVNAEIKGCKVDFIAKKENGALNIYDTKNRFKFMIGDFWDVEKAKNHNIPAAGTGAVWNGYFLPHLINGGAIALQGASLEQVVPLPFPIPQNNFYVDKILTTNEILFLHQQIDEVKEGVKTGKILHTLYRYSKGDQALTKFERMDLHGGILLASNKKGEVLGIRGGDYFVIKPGDKEPNLIPIPVEMYPRSILFLKADPEGILWGGPRFGQTLFKTNPIDYELIDLDKCKSINTKVVCDTDGEVYDIAFYQGKIYAVAYEGGDIIQYDPMQTWDQLNRKNPRTIASVGPTSDGVGLAPAKCHPTKLYSRPTGGIVLGPDSMLYSGWQKVQGQGYGGAIAITDPNTGETTIIENPLGEQTVSSLAVDDKFIYVSTSLAGNGLPPKPNESPSFGIIEMNNIKEEPIKPLRFDDLYSVGPIALDTKTKRMVISSSRSNESICELRVFDTLKRSEIPLLPESISGRTITSRTIAAPGNGKVYYGSERKVISLDLSSLEIVVLGEIPENINKNVTDNVYDIAVSKTLDVYACRGADVFKINY